MIIVGSAVAECFKALKLLREKLKENRKTSPKAILKRLLLPDATLPVVELDLGPRDRLPRHRREQLKQVFQDISTKSGLYEAPDAQNSERQDRNFKIRCLKLLLLMGVNGLVTLECSVTRLVQ